MTYDYGTQRYHNNMQNDCAISDPIPLTGARG
jgi:hypothetical protein